MQALRERAAASGQFAAVHALLGGYWEAVARQPPLALLLSPEAQLRGGAPDVVRGGPTLGTLRPATPAEALGVGLATPGQAGPAQVMSGLLWPGHAHSGRQSRSCRGKNRPSNSAAGRRQVLLSPLHQLNTWFGMSAAGILQLCSSNMALASSLHRDMLWLCDNSEHY